MTWRFFFFVVVVVVENFCQWHESPLHGSFFQSPHALPLERRARASAKDLGP